MEKKPNLKKGMKVRVVGRPTNVDLAGVAEADVKPGQLDTDLNRDVLWQHMMKKGV